MIKCSQLVAINCGRGKICNNDICRKNYYYYYVFQRWSKKFKLWRNRKHHKKRFTKTLVVMFSDFWLLINFKSSLKNLTNDILFCAQNFEYTMDFYIVLTMFCFTCLVQHSNIPSNKNITRQNWRKECCVRFGNFSSEIP